MILTRPEPPTETCIGPYTVLRSHERLQLVRDNRSEFLWKAGGFFLLAACCISILAVLSVVVGSKPDGTDALYPRRNVMGAFWAIGLVGMCVGGPLYMLRAYRSALTFTFDRTDSGVYRGQERVTRLGRIECLELCESHDPDGRFLYFLRLMYGDGRLLLLHNAYDEDEVRCLAHEVASFVGAPVRWR